MGDRNDDRSYHRRTTESLVPSIDRLLSAEEPGRSCGVGEGRPTDRVSGGGVGVEGCGRLEFVGDWTCRSG